MSTNQAKADVLSTFFSSVFTVEDSEEIPTIPGNFDGPTLDDVDISSRVVEEKLAALRPTSSPGPDYSSARPADE